MFPFHCRKKCFLFAFIVCLPFKHLNARALRTEQKNQRDGWMSLSLSQWAFFYLVDFVTPAQREDSIVNEIVISLSFQMEFVMRLASRSILTSEQASLVDFVLDWALSVFFEIAKARVCANKKDRQRKKRYKKRTSHTGECRRLIHPMCSKWCDIRFTYRWYKTPTFVET